MAKKTLVISFEIEKKEWIKAIQDGWKERFNEQLSEKEIKELDSVVDFVWAIRHLSESDVEDLTVEDL
jgi:hypothetical protein